MCFCLNVFDFTVHHNGKDTSSVNKNYKFIVAYKRFENRRKTNDGYRVLRIKKSIVPLRYLTLIRTAVVNLSECKSFFFFFDHDNMTSYNESSFIQTIPIVVQMTAVQSELIRNTYTLKNVVGF